jgi:hypothetical protein
VWAPRKKRIVSPLLLLVLACGACGSPSSSPQTTLDLKGQEFMTSEELRRELEAYCSNVVLSTIHASQLISDMFVADELEGDDLYRLRRRGYQVRLLAFRRAWQALNTPDPRASIIDLWAWRLQRKLYVESDRSLETFLGHEAYREPALESATTLYLLIESLAADVFSSAALEEVRAGVQEFARENPIQNNTRPTKRVSLEAETASIRWFSRWTGLARITSETERIAGEVERMSWMMTWLPAVARWETGMLLTELTNHPVVLSMDENLDRVTRSLEDLVVQSRELPRTLREEVTLTLDGIDARQAELRTTLQQAQELVGEGRRAFQEAREVVQMLEGMAGSRPEILAAVASTVAEVAGLSESLAPTLNEARGLLADLAEDGASDTASVSGSGVPADELLASVERTSRELNATTSALHSSLVELRGLLASGDLDRRVDDARTLAEHVVDHTFWRAIALVLVTVAAIVAGATLFRRFGSASS